MGQVLLCPLFRGINLGSGRSTVSKAMVQEQTDLSFPKPTILPLRYLGIPHYKSLPLLKVFPLCHLPSLIPPTHTHPLFSSNNEILLNPHGFLLPGLCICCLLHMEYPSPLIFAWYSIHPSGLSINMNCSKKSFPSTNPEKVSCFGYTAS